MPILRKLPIEIYVLLIPSFLAAAVFMLVYNFSIPAAEPVKVILQVFDLTSLMGGHKFYIAFSLFWIVAALVLFFNKKNLELKKEALNLVVITAIFSAIVVFLSIAILAIFHSVSPERVLPLTISIDIAERKLFGILPAVSLIRIFSGTVLEQFVLFSYLYLFLMFSLSMITSIVKSDTFRNLIDSFCLIFLVALPLFYLFPIFYPYGLYIAKTLGNVSLALPLFPQSDLLSAVLAHLGDTWISEDGTFLNVSAMPSLHAAWGIIAFLAVCEIRKKIRILIFSVWVVGNSVGAFYSLQHYSLDIFVGLIFGATVWYLNKKLLKVEKKYYTGRQWFDFSNVTNLKNLATKATVKYR